MKRTSKGASAPVQTPLIQSPVDRDDLTFTSRKENGCLSNWNVPHDKEGNWHVGIDTGLQHFSEVAALAALDEHEAFNAIEFALNDPGWKPCGWGIEMGFSQGLAAAAIIGLRALRSGAVQADDELIRLLSQFKHS